MSKIYPYAGFWKRAVAFLIDSIVLSIPMTIITMGLLIPQGMAFAKLAAAGTEPSPDVVMGMMGRYFASLALTWIIIMVGGWLYYALMESGKHQGTLGKMAMGIKVTGPHGERISFARATGRFFAKWISGMTLYFGFYMAGFTQKRQALHDIMATTLVIDKNYQENAQEIAEIPFSKGGCAAGIIAAVAPVVLYVCLFILMMIAGIAAGISEAQQTPNDDNSTAQFQFLGAETEDGEQVPFQLLDAQQSKQNSERDALTFQAEKELIRLKYSSSDPVTFPFTKDNITYNQTPQGYTATWNISPENQYVLLQKPKDAFACWLKVPANFDVRFSSNKPCK